MLPEEQVEPLLSCEELGVDNVEPAIDAGKTHPDENNYSIKSSYGPDNLDEPRDELSHLDEESSLANKVSPRVSPTVHGRENVEPVGTNVWRQLIWMNSG